MSGRELDSEWELPAGAGPGLGCACARTQQEGGWACRGGKGGVVTGSSRTHHWVTEAAESRPQTVEGATGSAVGHQGLQVTLSRPEFLQCDAQTDGLNVTQRQALKIQTPSPCRGVMGGTVTPAVD